MEELKKIDILRERLGVTYKEAKEALEQTGGDVVQALINLEPSREKWDDKLDQKGRELVEYIKELIKKGNVTKIRLKKLDKVIMEIPATVGAIGVGGAFFSPLLAIIGVVGTVAAFVSHYSLEIVRPNGTVEEHNLNFLEEQKSNEEEK
jgi:DNA-binding transcriptional MerR regulator